MKLERDSNRRATYRDHWWRHVEPRPALWAALASLADRHGRACPGHPRLSDAQQVVDARHKAGHDGVSRGARYIGTPRVAKHRLFVWLAIEVCPDSQVIAIARDDDTSFGILHSRFHEAWSLRLGTSLEDRPRYTPTTTFETFPFPAGLTPNIPAADYAADPRAHTHRRRREEARRPAPRVAQSARSRRDRSRGHADRRAGRSAAPLSRPHSAAQRRGGGQAQRAHADQPLQSAPALARRRPRSARPRRGRRLRLAGGHRDRRRAATPAGAQPRTRRYPLSPRAGRGLGRGVRRLAAPSRLASPPLIEIFPRRAGKTGRYKS